jgi:hypothetical protein
MMNTIRNIGIVLLIFLNSHGIIPINGSNKFKSDNPNDPTTTGTASSTSATVGTESTTTTTSRSREHQSSNSYTILDMNGIIQTEWNHDDSITTKDNSNNQAAVTYIQRTRDSDSDVVNVNKSHHSTTKEEQIQSPQQQHQHYPVPNGCKLVMAPSSLQHPNSGWGVYSLVHLLQGNAVIDGDVVIQITDFNYYNNNQQKKKKNKHEKQNNRTLQPIDYVWRNDYVWNSETTGGYYEGKHDVMSATPGIGMLANGLPNKVYYNVIPFVPNVDEGGLTRDDSPGAGAITHYHNYTFYTTKSIRPGTEIFVNYGTDWFQEHEATITTTLPTVRSSTTTKEVDDRMRSDDNHSDDDKTNIEWLKQNGICLDNIKPGKSKQIHAGRGAFAKRYVPVDHIVAPVPVLVISHKELMNIQPHHPLHDADDIDRKQLLLNYCYGHRHSTILLFPYSPMVKYVPLWQYKNTYMLYFVYSSGSLSP